MHIFPAQDSGHHLLPKSVELGLGGLSGVLQAEGCLSEVLLTTGKASEKIATYSETEDVSLIIVGKHGQNALAGRLIGSTAANLSEVAGRPVLMVP